MLINIPRFKCFVEKEFLTAGAESGRIEAYCFAVTLLESRPLLFTVHTIEGALFSRLPIWSLSHRAYPEEVLSREKLDPWGAISGNGHAVAYDYLKDYHTVVTVEGKQAEGRYAFTIDYFSGGFSEDPEQHKTSNIIFLEGGQICAVPNNFCLFPDSHFTRKEVTTGYKRSSNYYTLATGGER